MTTPSAETPAGYALETANASFRWYRTAARRSRRAHRASDIGAVVISAAIPVAAVLAPRLPQITAVLGAVLVIIAGARAIYHWQENYLRFSRAREAVEEQRRLYRVAEPPYDDPATRDAELVKAVTRIEQAEMGQWSQLSDARPAPRPAARE